MTTAAPTKSKKSAPAPAEPDTRPVVLGIIPKGELREIFLDKIIDPKGVPDRVARPDDDSKISELARSLREVGQLQPIMVEQLVDGRFCRVFGRRRLAAARLNKTLSMLALVVPPLQDDVRRTIVAIENMQRQDLTPAEEHLAVGELLELSAIEAAVQYGRQLKDHCGVWSLRIVSRDAAADIRRDPPAMVKAASHDMLLDPGVRSIAVDIVAAMLAKTRTWVLDRLYVSRLGKKGQELVRDGKLPLTHAREIAKVADPGMREQLAEDYSVGGDQAISEQEPGRLDSLRDRVAAKLFSLAQVNWKLDVPFAGKPACTGCPHNSASNPGLFDGTDKAVSTQIRQGEGYDYGYQDGKELEALHARGVCTFTSCFVAKTAATKGAVVAAAKKVEDGDKTPKIKPWIDPEAVAEKVKERKGRTRTHSSSGGTSRNAETANYAAKREAEIKWREVAQSHCDKINADILKAIKQKPASIVYYAVVSENGWSPKACKEAMACTREKLIAWIDSLLAKPPAINGPRVWHVDPRDVKHCHEMAEACGLKPEPAPVLADFMPKDMKVEAKPVSGKKVAKKPANKAGKKGARK